MPMTRYFFNLREGSEYTVDEFGVDLVTLDDVMAQATRCAREMIADSVLDGNLITGNIFEIIDEYGTTIANIRFRDLVRET